MQTKNGRGLSSRLLMQQIVLRDSRKDTHRNGGKQPYVERLQQARLERGGVLSISGLAPDPFVYPNHIPPAHRS